LAGNSKTSVLVTLLEIACVSVFTSSAFASTVTFSSVLPIVSFISARTVCLASRRTSVKTASLKPVATAETV
jgi:hypothetical protein